VKKRADMAMSAERRIGKPHWSVVLFARFIVVLGGVHRVFSFWLKIQVVENRLFARTDRDNSLTNHSRDGFHETVVVRARLT
jgi:hypothetical protein